MRKKVIKEENINTEFSNSIISTECLKLNTLSKYIEESEASYFGSSGLFLLDLLLGKGIPGGNFIEIYGIEKSGKSTLGLFIAGYLQTQDYIVIYLDVDATIDLDWARKNGVNPDLLIYEVPDNLEQLIKLTEDYIDLVLKEYKGKKVIMFWDTLGACGIKKEQEGELEDTLWGVFPKMVTKAVKIIHSKIKKEPITIVVLNEIRDKMNSLGSESKPPGGRKLEHAVSIRLKSVIKEIIKDKDKEPTGVMLEIKVDKNKYGRPYLKGNFKVDFNEGLDNIGSLVYFGIDKKIIKTEGAWYSFNNIKKNGKQNMVNAIKEDNNSIEKLKLICSEYFKC